MDTEEIFEYANSKYNAMLAMLRKLAPIPAPSGNEDKRVEFLNAYLKELGFENIGIDDAKNVIVPFIIAPKAPIVVAMAHTDVVFPDTTMLPFSEDESHIYCPGIADDTARVVQMAFAFKYFIEKNIKLNTNFLFVANSSEEGLGNLKGCREICKKYGNQIATLISADAETGEIINKAVGSHRYRIKLETEGGHSWIDFGNQNAIVHCARLISDLSSIQIPAYPNAKTTFNVGTVNGGTSVNTIAQNAEFLYEYRSDYAPSLAYMKDAFEKTISAHKSDEVKISVEMLGERPCSGNIDPKRQAKLEELAEAALYDTTGLSPTFCSGSTDANIPLSLGIPALTIGTCISEGMHKREEKLEKASLAPGLALLINLLLRLNSAI